MVTATISDNQGSAKIVSSSFWLKGNTLYYAEIDEQIARVDGDVSKMKLGGAFSIEFRGDKQSLSRIEKAFQ